MYDRLIADNAFRNLTEMKRYCAAYMNRAVNKDCRDGFNFYFEGEHWFFWIRYIARFRDYNLYLHAFTKEPKGEAS